MCRVSPLVFVLLLLPAFGLLLSAPAVHASVSVVQNTGKHLSASPGPASLAFTTPVTSGNVVVVAILTGNPAGTVSSVTDSLPSSYTQAIQRSDLDAADTAAIYYATLAKGGSDTVTVTLTSSSTWDFYIFEVSGIAPPTLTTGSGASGPTPSSSVATASTSFTSPAFLIAVVGFGDCGFTTPSETISPGSGFSYVTAPSGALCSAVEIADPVTPPTTFPGTIKEGGSTFSDNWVEVGAAFSAPPAPPIPEYPLGLPVLAVLAALAYVVIKRRTTKKLN